MAGLDQAYRKWLGEFEPKIRQRRLAEGLSRIAGSVAQGIFQGWQNRQRARQIQGFLSEFAKRRGADVPEIEALRDPDLLAQLGVEATTTSVREALEQRRRAGLQAMAERLLGAHGASADWTQMAPTPEDLASLLPAELQVAREEARGRRATEETRDAIRAFLERQGIQAPELQGITMPGAMSAVAPLVTSAGMEEAQRRRRARAVGEVLGPAFAQAGLPLPDEAVRASPETTLGSLELLERYLRTYGGTGRSATGATKRPSRQIDKEWLKATGIEDVFDELPDALRAADILKMAAGEDAIEVQLKNGETVKVPIQWTDTIGQIVPPAEFLGTQLGKILAMRNQAINAIANSLQSGDPTDQAHALRAMRLLSINDPTIEWQIRKTMPDAVRQAEMAALMLDSMAWAPGGGARPMTPLDRLRGFMKDGAPGTPALPAPPAVPRAPAPTGPVPLPPSGAAGTKEAGPFFKMEFPRPRKKKNPPHRGLTDFFLSGDK